jgi:hypothetical protein
VKLDHYNPLPGVPLIESPLFDEFLGAEQLDSETYRIARDLHDNGFAIFDFPDAQIAEVSARIIADLAPRYDLDGWRDGRIASPRIQDAWTFNADVRRIATNEPVRRLLSQLYGREAFPFQSLSFPVGTQQHAHTDSVHFSSMPERFMCGVWVALEDTGLDQGPLLYYPGSHKWPIYTNEHIGHVHMRIGETLQTVYEPMWDRLVAARRLAPVRFEAKAGQALIWAANLLHGGDQHVDRNKTRWSQVTHYYFEDCCYYTPMMSDGPFGSIQFREPYNIVSGEPVKNKYQGVPIPETYMASTSPKVVSKFWPDNIDRFDHAAYLNANPDVAAAGMDALDHYLRYGRVEGRKLGIGSPVESHGGFQRIDEARDPALASPRPVPKRGGRETGGRWGLGILSR